MTNSGSSQADSIKRRQEESLTREKASVYELPYVDLSQTPIDRDAFSVLSEDVAQNKVIVIKEQKGVVQIAISNPNDPTTKNILNNLRDKYDRVDVFIGSETGIKEAWESHTSPKTKKKDITGSVQVSENILERFKGEITTVDSFQGVLNEISDQNASHVFELILSSALSMEATDIHIEPRKEGAIVRLKLDGLLYETAQLDDRLYKLVLSRIKLLSKLKLNIHDQPQEGRFSVMFEGRVVEIRASLLPSEYKEDIALRILDPKFLLSLSDLGIRDDLLATFKKQLTKPDGILFVTGPTGSGKTTTLYAGILHLNTPRVKIITIEDPIEYHVKGTTQTQVNEDEGYTFSAGLKAILRQDPDIVLIGELRERESAEVALQGALAGRKVLTTLHTMDAAGTAPRLTDLGIDPATTASALTASIAQRLVRKLCDACKVEKTISNKEYSKLSPLVRALPQEIQPELSDNQTKIYKNNPEGCSECRGTGYKGRVGVFEILTATKEIKNKISENPTDGELRDFAISQGMTTITQDAALKILNGITSIEEVERILGPLSE
ncbi:MAG: GspE/PulE family protein [Candidatus Spechtbacterales bacterium]|nr:GspE/PulE family protein [Candidatus Spechtbacterales bacterium]